VGRNPRTGEEVAVPERRVVTYRQGKELAMLMASPTSVEQPPETATREEPYSSQTSGPLGKLVGESPADEQQ